MPSADNQIFRDAFPSVSRETIHRLETYARMLEEWNQKFNLVAKSTIPEMWQRHFLDSAQLLKYLPENKVLTIADMGSGAGFPGLVISIMSRHKVHLIESTGKKASFLQAVISELGLDAIVHNKRIEDIGNLRADVVTARALKALPELLALTKQLIKKDSFCVFLKGQNLDAELTAACKCWKFSYDRFSSLSDRSGNVLIVKNLQLLDGNVSANRKLRKRK